MESNIKEVVSAILRFVLTYIVFVFFYGTDYSFYFSLGITVFAFWAFYYMNTSFTTSIFYMISLIGVIWAVLWGIHLIVPHDYWLLIINDYRN